MKIMICGEGAHDIGVADHWMTAKKQYVSLDGWLQPLIRSIRGSEELSLAIRKRRDLTFLQSDAQRLRPLPKGHGGKALAAKRAALLGSFDVLVFMVDTDNTDEKRWREIGDEIADGFARIEGNVVCIACVPLALSECWLLADSQAWCEIGATSETILPRHPEKIWGERRDPEGDHPHQFFSRVCASYGVADDRETRVAVSTATNIETLAMQCPISFPPFRETLAAA